MTWIPPLLVAIPLLAGAFVAGANRILPRRVLDAIGVAAAASTLALAIVLLLETQRGDVVHWFGGWKPRDGIAFGIAFTADPLGAGMAALVAGVVLLALVYSLVYLEEAVRLFDTLMLICLAALCGFAISGDLFNMFVWLELMGVAAYALTGFDIRHLGPLQGAVNFAIVNTLGGYFVLLGIALVYARTGALNLAQIGRELVGSQADGLVIVAMTLILVGFLCKAAVVPFHLWLADAYAVAPIPVCVVFAGVMTGIGLFGVARVYWTVFDAPFAPHAQSVGDLLLWLGIVTALLGGVMAFLQRHLKRMLAFSVTSHIGVMLAGIGLLDSSGLAGTADLLLAHGLLTGGLFLSAGILLATQRSIDELRLRGRGRGLRWLGALWLAAALGLVGPPYVGAFLGHAQIDDAAAAAGRYWIPPLLWLASALAGAALLRAGARVFLGWGPGEDPLLSRESDETPPKRGKQLAVLGPVTALMIVLGLAVSVVPGLATRTHAAADRFRDRSAYVQHVLFEKPAPAASRLPFDVPLVATESFLYGAGAPLLAVALAWLALFRRRAAGALLRPVAPLRALHTGVIGDYVMWLTVGTAVIGGVWAIALR
jgi:multicomponent Na+:H+ antiporter subunit D